MALQDLLGKARKLAKGREKQIGRGLDKAEEAISRKTDGKYDAKVRNARRKVDESLSDRPDEQRRDDPGTR